VYAVSDGAAAQPESHGHVVRDAGMTPVTLRPVVQRFAELMEAKLKENDKKGGWGNCSTAYLSRRCGNELGELRAAVNRGKHWVRQSTFLSGRGPVISDNEELRLLIGREAADVANFAMMIADVCGALK
jgi:hypothetical protein